MPFIIPAIAAAVETAAVVGSFITSLGVIGQGIIAAGIGIASTFLVSALSPKPVADTTQGGVNFERQYGSDVPRQVACGLVGIAGHDTYVNTFNPSNRTLQQIYTLSDYYATALTRVAIGGVWVIIGPDIGDGKGHQLMPTTAEQTWSGSIWVKFFDGRQTVADGFLTTFANPAGRWTTASIGIGIAAVSVLVEYDKDHNNSFPDFFFEFKGAPIYDWRKDSTNGGSGTHRWNDFTTHEYTTNPILIERHYRRGFIVNGDPFCGMDMQESELPVTKWTVAANICDEIDVDDGLPRYQVSIILDCMQPHTSNLQSLSLSCGSMQIDSVDGSWPLVGTDQPIVATFTDDDIIDISDVEFQRYKSMGELVNSVAGNYPEPDQIWSMIGYNEQIATAFLTLDRRTRDLSMDFPMVPVARQAAQLAFIYLYENRFEATATITLRPYFQKLEEGDWVNWNSTDYGLLTFIITNKSLRSLESDGPRNVVLQLQQRDGSIYNGITPIPIVFPTTNAGPVYLAEVQSFGLAQASLQGSDGRAIPAIRASWTPTIPVDVTVTDVQLIYYPTAQPTQILTKTVKADVSVAYLDSVVSNTDYTVQAKIITNPSRVTVFNAGLTIHTLNITQIYSDLATEIQYQISTVNDLFSDKLSFLEALFTTVLSNKEIRDWKQINDLRTQVSSQTGNALSQISTLSQTMTSADAALAKQITTINSQLNDNVSSVQITASTFNSLLQSYAAYKVDVSAAFNGSSSTASFGVTTVSTLNGYAGAQFAITLDVNGYGVGFNLINGGGGIAAAVFTVPKFQIASPGVGGGAAVPIFTVGNVGGVPKIGMRADVFIDGTINAQNAVIAGTITGTLIQAAAINTLQLSINSVDITKIIAGAATFQKSVTYTYNSSTTFATTGLISIQGGTASVLWAGDLAISSSGVGTFVVQLQLDGSTVKTYTFASPASGPFTFFWDITGVSVGNHTVSLVSSVTGGAGYFSTGNAGMFRVQDLRR